MALAALDCSHNKLTSLNVAPNRFYEGLDCSFNHLTFGTLPPMTHVC
ncbi:hypothetical protein LX69_01244 [Breznakibacter xylanolyticus]|uniref:Leucine rich repeat (LRR) protein n=1 Tax=Breznakibacter xylanolyticus TaxID=990 RepID=A0A2W7NBU7_9BACT|nr:hypothetical protein LX69_01244 [Breznakibacter xylanolyticus]